MNERLKIGQPAKMALYQYGFFFFLQIVIGNILGLVSTGTTVQNLRYYIILAAVSVAEMFLVRAGLDLRRPPKTRVVLLITCLTAAVVTPYVLIAPSSLNASASIAGLILGAVLLFGLRFLAPDISPFQTFSALSDKGDLNGLSKFEPTIIPKRESEEPVKQFTVNLTNTGGVSRGFEELTRLIEKMDQSLPVSSFFFKLEGQKANGNAVEFASDVDLVFDYDFPDPEILAIVQGKGLKLAVENDGDIGITVLPTGFSFRDDAWYKVAKFRNGRIVEPVRFLLTAVDESTAKRQGISNDPRSSADGASFFIILDAGGFAHYEFSLGVQLVRSLAVAKKPMKGHHEVTLDLDQMISRAKRAEEILARPVEVKL